VLDIEGPTELVRNVAEWFPQSAFAPHARAASYDPATRSFGSVSQ
jgi:hypothetical protein